MSFAIRICTLLVLASATRGQDDSDKLWIFIDKVNLYECQGVTNVWELKKEDITITDKNGEPQYWFLEAPNDYTINFNKIGVKKPVPNLSGNLAVTIQVPVVSVGNTGISLDLPYQILPQKKLFNSGCDNESGVFNVASEKRDYCRYCDLCEVESHVENKLGSAKEHKYVEVNDQETFTKTCSKIDATTYQLKKKVSVPGKKELEREAKAAFPGDTLSEDTQKRFKVGKGKLQVFLNAMSSDQAPTKPNQFYPNKKNCECCMKDSMNNKVKECQKSLFSLFAGSSANNAANFVGNTDPCTNCNNEFVKSCVKGNSQVIGCYRAEFNFRVTDKRSDFEEYKKQIAYDKAKAEVKAKQNASGTSGTSGSGASGTSGSGATGTSGSGATGTSGSGAAQPSKAQVAPAPSTGGAGGGGVTPCDQCSKDACVANIRFKATSSYCSNYWNKGAKGYCCSKCSTVCST